MLSRREHRLLAGIEEGLRQQDPGFTGELDTWMRPERREDSRVLMLLLMGGLVLCVGVGVLYFDPAIGAPLAALGCVILASAVLAARRVPDHQNPPEGGGI